MKKAILIILDGWGVTQNPEVSAIAKANTPYIDGLFAKYANSQLQASGLSVGLPDGQMGNSEVGHMNIGAGRIVYQDLVRINKAVEDGEIKTNSVLTDAYRYAKENNKKVHFLGLVSDGGVHSHTSHLRGLITSALENGADKVFVHAFTDGRDTDPKSGLNYLKNLEEFMANTTAKIATVTGRYYAMDRDKRWERVKLAYDALVAGVGTPVTSVTEAMQAAYNEGTTDEFIKPMIADANGLIEPNDVVVFFNFRTDRGRELTMALSQQEFPEQGMKPMPLYYVTLTNYDDTFKNVHVVYDKDNLDLTLGEVVSAAGRTQIRIAETEKYPHVTFFFSGGREEPFAGEDRILCPSPKVATYDLQPEMSAWDIANAIVPRIEAQSADFICLNFANPDMVGHTGVFEAAVKACETVDKTTEAVVEAARKAGYASLIIADHGNSDFMVNPDGSPNTAHTTNPVPCVLVDDQFTGKLNDGILGDVAPTILDIMGIEQPARMTGKSLIVR